MDKDNYVRLNDLKLEPNATPAAIEMTELTKKALTYQHPNERELKNEVRWIYCWNLWTELSRQRIRLVSAALGQEFDRDFKNELQIPFQDTKEYLLTELQSLIVKKPLQTLSKVKANRRIKEIGLRIDIWDKVRREAVLFLSFLQIQICNYKCGESNLSLQNYKLLEKLKDAYLEKILCACKNIELYYKELEEAVVIFKSFRCHALFTDPTVAKWMEKSALRKAQAETVVSNSKRPHSRLVPQAASPAAPTPLSVLQLPSPATALTPLSMWNSKTTSGPTGDTTCSRRTPCSTPGNVSTISALDNPDIPDFMEPLFATRKPIPVRPSPASLPPKAMASVRDAMLYYVEILQQGTCWFFAWCQFTDAVLREIKRYFPSLGTEVVSRMTKHISNQITLLKGLLVEVNCMGDKIRKLTSKEAEMSAMMTCLATLDDFVSLIESIKHEASYLIRYVEIELINLGVLDVNREPTKAYPLRLYRIRNTLTMKDTHLLTSVDYLYSEMAYLLEFIELQFYAEKSYLDKYGHLTADLFKKYTVGRREFIQEKENQTLQMIHDSEAVNDLSHATNKGSLAQLPIYLSPISRHQRAEDLRKWVEQSTKMVPFPPQDESSPHKNSEEETLLLHESCQEGCPGVEEDRGDQAVPKSSYLAVPEPKSRWSLPNSPAVKSVNNSEEYSSPGGLERTPRTPAFYLRNDPELDYSQVNVSTGGSGEQSTLLRNVKLSNFSRERPSKVWTSAKSGAKTLKKSVQKKLSKKSS